MLVRNAGTEVTSIGMARKTVTVLATLLLGAVYAQIPAAARGPVLTVVLHDDNVEDVTFQGGSAALVSQELRDAAFAAAGCESVDEVRGYHAVKTTCRHAVARAGTVISSSWDFSPLEKVLAKSGATGLTTCIEHPDWPFSENDRHLPLQHISGKTAHCGAWPLLPVSGPLELGIKAGYEAKQIQPVIWAAVIFTVLFGAAGWRLGRGSDFLSKHTILTFWTVSCFVWMAIILRLDGLRMLSLWFGSSGNSRWLWTGLVASAPPFGLAFLLSLRQEPAVSAKLRRNAALCLTVFVLTAAVLCGVSQVDPLELAAYALVTPVAIVLLRTRASVGAGGGAKLAAVPQGELLTSFQNLSAKAGIATPGLMFMNIPGSQAAGAAAMVGRRRLILITPNLLDVCSKREVDAILGHELAHFVQYRRAVQSVFLFAMLGLMLTGAAIEQHQQMWLVAAAGACVLLMSATTRWMEYVADRFGVRSTGDPEALASALVKIGGINQTPVRGNGMRELFLSHPWTDKRLRRMNVQIDAAAEPSSGEPKYAIDPASGMGRFSRPLGVFVQRLVKYSPFLLARIWTVSLAAGILIGLLPASDLTALLVLGGAVAAGFVGIAALWARNMERVGTAVRELLLKIHGSTWDDAVFCGMAPGLGRTVFDSGYHWDVGLLKIDKSTLCYGGDRASFTVPRAAIRGIELRTGPLVRWTKSHVLCIHLADSRPAGLPASIAFEASPGARYRIRRRLGVALLEKLQSWHVQDVQAPEEALLPVQSATWPQGQAVLKRIVSGRVFWRYAAVAVAPVLIASRVIWGWREGPESTMPAVAAFLLVTLFLGRGALLREQTLVGSPPPSPTKKT